MIKYIDVNITREHCYECNNYVIGRKDENNSEVFRFHLPDEMLDKNIYINFQKGDGTKIKSPKLEINTTEKIATFNVTNQLTDVIGFLLVEIEVNDGEKLVWKSNIKRYKIVDSISATDEIAAENEDFITDAQKVVNQANNLDIEVNKVDSETTIKVTQKDGTTQEVKVLDGKDGKDGTNGVDGNDYVLTEADKKDIADIAMTEIDKKIGDISNALDSINGEIV